MSDSPTPELIDYLKAKAARLRRLSIEATTQAGSGHPTSCMSAADVASALFFHELRLNAKNPADPAADEFVLSKGHAAPLLYAALAERGIIPAGEVKTLREFTSRLEGHPTPRFEWVKVATGSLGQGLSIALGMAEAARMDRSPARIFTLLGDGECAEGSVWEAAALAPVRRLDNLCAIVDANGLGQSGRTMAEGSGSWFAEKFRAFGWHVPEPFDGHDLTKVLAALAEFGRVRGKPTALVALTIKGKGVKSIEGKEGWHGKPIPAKDLAQALSELPLVNDLPFRDGLSPIAAPPPTPSPKSFEIPPPAYAPGQEVATREAFGFALAKLGGVHPHVVSLDGDTKNSTYAEKFKAAHPDRYVECYIAEQNMVGMAVGLSKRGKIPFVSTFGAFLTRAYDFIRMAAISQANLKLVGSHAGVSIGEDGPSQMALEDFAMMRAVIGSTVLCPSDGVSAEWLTAEAARIPGIVYLRTARPKTPVIYEAKDRDFRAGGARLVRSGPGDQLTIVAAGVCVHEALAAAEALKGSGKKVRVVDAYSIKPVAGEIIAKAVRETGGRLLLVEDHYAEGGLGEAVRSAVEGAATKVTHLAVREIPRSGKKDELMEAYGVGRKSIERAARNLIS